MGGVFRGIDDRLDHDRSIEAEPSRTAASSASGVSTRRDQAPMAAAIAAKSTGP
jgi:hypothetical protein